MTTSITSSSITTTDLTVDSADNLLKVDHATNRVGIGTTSPSNLLTLKADSTEETMLMFQNDSAVDIGAISIHPSNGLVIANQVPGSSVHIMTHDGNEDINLDSDGFIQFEVAGSELMRLTNTGVGIGVTSPNAKLEVRNSTTATDSIIASAGLATAGNYHNLILGDGPNYAVGLRRHITQSNPSYLRPRLDFIVQNANTYLPADRQVRMTINDDGEVGIGTTNPSVNLEVSDSGNSFILVKNTSSGSGLYIKADTGGDAELQTAGGNNTLVMRTSGHERMRITSDGVVSMPHQCNVSAFPSASTVTITQNSTWQILQFNSTRWDNNSDYNTSNSRFTAPVTGKYLFGINLQLEGVTGIIWTYIVPIINGNAAGTSGNNMADFTPPNGTYFNHAATWMVTLSANDYVELQAIGSGGSFNLKGNTESSYYIALMA